MLFTMEVNSGTVRLLIDAICCDMSIPLFILRYSFHHIVTSDYSICHCRAEDTGAWEVGEFILVACRWFSGGGSEHGDAFSWWPSCSAHGGDQVTLPNACFSIVLLNSLLLKRCRHCSMIVALEDDCSRVRLLVRYVVTVFVVVVDTCDCDCWPAAGGVMAWQPYENGAWNGENGSGGAESEMAAEIMAWHGVVGGSEVALCRRLRLKLNLCRRDSASGDWYFSTVLWPIQKLSDSL